MFFGRKSSPVDLVTDSEEYTVGPPSPIPSNAAARTSIALKRKSSQMSIMSRFSRQSVATSVTSTTSIGANIKELTEENVRIRDELEQAQEQSRVNQHMLNACVDKLEDKEHETAELRSMIQKLQDKLAASKITDEAQEDLVMDPGMEIKQMRIVNQNQVEVLSSTKEHMDGKTVEHEAQVFVLKLRIEDLEVQLRGCQQQVSVQDECADEFRAEKESLTRRIAILDKIDAQRKESSNKVQEQIIAITQAYTTEQQQHRCALDDLHTTLHHHRKTHEDQVAVYKIEIKQLQAQLEEARRANDNTESFNINEMIELQDQVRRSQLDLDNMTAEKVSWQDWANKQAAALEQATMLVEK